jgi:hypothetical protein
MARLVVVGGWIASGKSTVARALGEWLGAPVLGADALRRELAGAGARDAQLPGFSERLYPELLARAGAALAAGGSAVLDGAFRSRRQRAEARALAARYGAAFRFVECRAPRATCRERLSRRGPAEEVRGWLALFEHFLEHEWQPVEELPAQEHLALDTTRPLEETLARLRCWLE